MCFFQGQTLFWPYLRNGWSDWCEMKRKCMGWILGIICDLDIWPHWWPFLTLNVSRSNFEIAVSQELVVWCEMKRKRIKDRAHLSTFKIFIFEKFSCFIVLVVFLVIVQSSELVSVWFCEKMTFFPNFFSYHIFAIYVGGASLGLPTACRLIAVSGARLPSVYGLVVRCIKMHHHVKSAITICLQFI